MPLYESTFIVRQDVSGNELETIVKEISDHVAEYGAKILKTEKWGLRNLAYPIKKNNKGHYTHFVIEGDSGVPALLAKEYKHRKENVIRELTVLTETFSEKPSHMMQEKED